MSQALNPPNNSTIGGKGVDAAITIIQRELARLPCLEQNLGRVIPQVKTPGTLPEPWIYKGDGEYYQAYPNDTMQSFSCLYAHDDELIEGYGFLGKRTLSVIFWVDFGKLEMDVPTVEELKQEVITKLRTLSCVSSIGKTYDQTVSGAAGIYPNFDVSGFETKYLTYPYGGFRIETEVNYTTNLCY